MKFPVPEERVSEITPLTLEASIFNDRSECQRWHFFTELRF